MNCHVHLNEDDARDTIGRSTELTEAGRARGTGRCWRQSQERGGNLVHGNGGGYAWRKASAGSSGMFTTDHRCAQRQFLLRLRSVPFTHSRSK
jgi:hypothetical protein